MKRLSRSKKSSEVTTSSIIVSLVENRTRIPKDDLINSAKEVMYRRGLACPINSYVPVNTKPEGINVQ